MLHNLRARIFFSRAPPWALSVLIMIGVVFEVGIRFMPADGMSFVQTDAAGHTVFSYASHDLNVVNGWRAYINSEPSESAFSAICGSPAYTVSPLYFTFTFTWHSIPVESAWTNDNPQSVLSDGNLCRTVIVSSGGLPNIFTRTNLQGDPYNNPAGPPPVYYPPNQPTE